LITEEHTTAQGEEEMCKIVAVDNGARPEPEIEKMLLPGMTLLPVILIVPIAPGAGATVTFRPIPMGRAGDDEGREPFARLPTLRVTSRSDVGAFHVRTYPARSVSSVATSATAVSAMSAVKADDARSAAAAIWAGQSFDKLSAAPLASFHLP